MNQNEPYTDDRAGMPVPQESPRSHGLAQDSFNKEWNTDSSYKDDQLLLHENVMTHSHGRELQPILDAIGQLRDIYPGAQLDMGSIGIVGLPSFVGVVLTTVTGVLMDSSIIMVFGLMMFFASMLLNCSSIMAKVKSLNKDNAEKAKAYEATIDKSLGSLHDSSDESTGLKGSIIRMLCESYITHKIPVTPVSMGWFVDGLNHGWLTIDDFSRLNADPSRSIQAPGSHEPMSGDESQANGSQESIEDFLHQFEVEEDDERPHKWRKLREALSSFLDGLFGSNRTTWVNTPQDREFGNPYPDYGVIPVEHDIGMDAITDTPVIDPLVQELNDEVDQLRTEAIQTGVVTGESFDAALARPLDAYSSVVGIMRTFPDGPGHDEAMRLVGEARTALEEILNGYRDAIIELKTNRMRIEVEYLKTTAAQGQTSNLG